MKRIFNASWLFCICLQLCAVNSNAGNPRVDTTRPHTIIVMFDGLRPDYITPQLMPRLFDAQQKGAYGLKHHSVYPTVTRVNAASYATGSYPRQHGLMENSLYLPAIEAHRTFNTGNARQLMEIDEKMNGRLLAVPSLGEVLDASGEQLFVYSSGTTGQAFLQNHKVKGAIINPELILPDNIKDNVIRDLGNPPADATPNVARHQWITDALIRYTLKKDGPLVSAIWFSDPDGTAHEHGIGLPITNEALRAVDKQFGRILDSIAARGLQQNFNIIVSADHGFISYSGSPKLVDFLIEKGLKESKTSNDVVIAGSSIYVKNHDLQLTQRIVETLQQQEWVGAVFTKAGKPGSPKGIIRGTLSFDVIRWNYEPRLGDIVLSENWNDELNAYGYPGTAAANGPAGHGGSSKYEIHIALIAFGPSFKPAYKSELPSSNIDIVPTILSIYRLPSPQTLQGRVLKELLLQQNASTAQPVKTKTLRAAVKQKGWAYQVEMEVTEYNGYRYINFIKANRSKN